MLDALDAPREALVVMDRGIATEECGNGCARMRIATSSSAANAPDTSTRKRRCASRPRSATACICTRSSPTQEVRLHCFSERAHRRAASRFEQALTKLSEGLSRPRTEKRASNIRERIGRLKAKSRGIAQHYHIELDTDPTGERATAVRMTVSRAR